MATMLETILFYHNTHLIEKIINPKVNAVKIKGTTFKGFAIHFPNPQQYGTSIKISAKKAIFTAKLKLTNKDKAFKIRIPLHLTNHLTGKVRIISLASGWFIGDACDILLQKKNCTPCTKLKSKHTQKIYYNICGL